MPSLGFGQLPTFFFPGSCLQRVQCAHASSQDKIDGLTDLPVISICKTWRGGRLTSGKAMPRAPCVL